MKQAIELSKVILTLQEVRGELATRYKVRSLGVFGSYVKDLQKPDSDLDILVEFEDEADLFHLAGLGIYLEQLFGCKVDIVPKKALREELKAKVLEEVISV